MLWKIALGVVALLVVGVLYIKLSAVRVPPADARQLVGEGALLLDVRTEAEYADGGIEGSVNIPYDEIHERIFEVTVDQDADIRVYCRSGRRSGIAKNVLESLGFTAVTNEGGFEEIKARRARKER